MKNTILTAEAAFAYQETAEEFLKCLLQESTQEKDAVEEGVFSTDETGLLYKNVCE